MKKFFVVFNVDEETECAAPVFRCIKSEVSRYGAEDWAEKAKLAVASILNEDNGWSLSPEDLHVEIREWGAWELLLIDNAKILETRRVNDEP